MPRLNPRNAAIAVVGVLLLLIILYLAFGRGDENQDRLTEEEEQAEQAAANPERRCAAQATYDQIKSELFRRAAAVRGSDQEAFAQLADYSAVRMERPVLEAHDEERDVVQCSGFLSLDLAPGVAVGGGRRSLSTQLDYRVQPAADGSGNVVTIGDAGPIINSLATLARIEQPVQEPADDGEPTIDIPEEGSSDPLAPLPSPPPPPSTPSPPPQPSPSASANPSFDCRNASTRSEIEVCSNAGLAALDRSMAAVYNRAVQRANAQEQGLLRQTRDRFLRYRDNCRTERCIADAYRGRIREIGDIMAGRWQAPR